MIARLAALALAGLATWTAVPYAWLRIGSALQDGGLSVPLTGLVMLAGAAASIVAMVRVLAVINRGYQAARVRRGLDDTGNFPLEVTLVCAAFTAGLALLAGWAVFGS